MNNFIVKLNKNAHLYIWLLDIILLIPLLYLFIASFISFGYILYISDPNANEYTDHWGTTPIKQISLEGKDEYTLQKLRTNLKGCNCIGINSTEIPEDNRNKILWETSCSKSIIKLGCHDIPSTTNIFKLNKWVNETFYITFDSRNYTSFHLGNYTVPKDQNCFDNYTQCGYLDDYYKLCLPNGETCPINEIAITNNEIPPVEGYNYNTLFLQKENKYLHYSNEFIENKVIVSLESAFDKICFDRNRFDFPTKDFPLRDIQNIQCINKEGGIQYNNEYKLIDSQNMFEYLNDNEVINYINKHIPEYSHNELKNFQTSLYYKTYYTPQQQSTLPYHSTNYYGNQFIDIGNDLLNFASYTYLVANISIIITIIWCCTRISKKCHYTCMIVGGIIKIISIVLSVFLFIHLNSVTRWGKNCKDYLQGVISKEISDSYLSQIDIAQDKADFIFLHFIVVIIYLILVVIWFVLCILILYNNNYDNYIKDTAPCCMCCCCKKMYMKNNNIHDKNNDNKLKEDLMELKPIEKPIVIDEDQNDNN